LRLRRYSATIFIFYIFFVFFQVSTFENLCHSGLRLRRYSATMIYILYLFLKVSTFENLCHSGLRLRRYSATGYRPCSTCVKSHMRRRIHVSYEEEDTCVI
jgi:hypothetical protein